MVSWHDFAPANPELAAHVRRCFAVRKHATLATLRRDGSPRISGTEVDFADDGDLCLGMMPGSLKAVDLRRDPRLALHSPTEDTPQSNPTSWLGDAKIAGVALETADGSNLFRIGMSEVVLITVEGDHLAIRSWHPDRGVEVKER